LLHLRIPLCEYGRLDIAQPGGENVKQGMPAGADPRELI